MAMHRIVRSGGMVQASCSPGGFTAAQEGGVSADLLPAAARGIEDVL